MRSEEQTHEGACTTQSVLFNGVQFHVKNLVPVMTLQTCHLLSGEVALGAGAHHQHDVRVTGADLQQRD